MAGGHVVTHPGVMLILAPRMYTPSEVAQLAGVSIQTIDRRIDDGTIEIIKIGRLRRIAPDVVARFLSARVKAAK